MGEKIVYTIEYGNIDNGERTCTNEESYLYTADFYDAIARVLKNKILNNSHDGFYIETYKDIYDCLEQKDLEYILQYHTMEMGADKSELIQEIVINNKQDKKIEIKGIE